MIVSWAIGNRVRRPSWHWWIYVVDTSIIVIIAMIGMCCCTVFRVTGTLSSTGEPLLPLDASLVMWPFWGVSSGSHVDRGAKETTMCVEWCRGSPAWRKGVWNRWWLLGSKSRILAWTERWAVMPCIVWTAVIVLLGYQLLLFYGGEGFPAQSPQDGISPHFSHHCPSEF